MYGVLLPFPFTLLITLGQYKADRKTPVGESEAHSPESLFPFMKFVCSVITKTRVAAGP